MISQVFWHSIILHKNRHKSQQNRNLEFRESMEMLIKHEYFCRVFLSDMCLSLSLGTSRCNWIHIIFFRAMGLQYKSCFDGNTEIWLKFQITDFVTERRSQAVQFFSLKKNRASFWQEVKEVVQRSILISAKFPTKPPISWKGFRI